MPIVDGAANPLPKSQILQLYIGKKFTGVTVEPDGRWPSMWRVHKGERISDMVNLSRAKDAAITWGSPPKGLGSGDVVHWRTRLKG
jgi:hypothetical protein